MAWKRSGVQFPSAPPETPRSRATFYPGGVQPADRRGATWGATRGASAGCNRKLGRHRWRLTLPNPMEGGDTHAPGRRPAVPGSEKHGGTGRRVHGPRCAAPWMASAACRGLTDLFSTPNVATTTASKRHGPCATNVPVWRQCLDYSMTPDAPLDGVLAGLSGRDRRQLRQDYLIMLLSRWRHRGGRRRPGRCRGSTTPYRRSPPGRKPSCSRQGRPILSEPSTGTAQPSPCAPDFAGPSTGTTPLSRDKGSTLATNIHPMHEPCMTRQTRGPLFSGTSCGTSTPGLSLSDQGFVV